MKRISKAICFGLVAYMILSRAAFAITVDGDLSDWNDRNSLSINIDGVGFKISNQGDSIYLAVDNQDQKMIPIMMGDILIPVLTHESRDFSVSIESSSDWTAMFMVDRYNQYQSSLQLKSGGDSTLRSGYKNQTYGSQYYEIKENNNVIEVKIPTNLISKYPSEVEVVFYYNNIKKESNKVTPQTYSINTLPSYIKGEGVVQDIERSINSNINTDIHGFVSATVAMGLGGSITAYSNGRDLEVHGSVDVNLATNYDVKKPASFSIGLAFGDTKSLLESGGQYQAAYIGIGRTVDTNGNLTWDGLSMYVHPDVMPSITGNYSFDIMDRFVDPIFNSLSDFFDDNYNMYMNQGYVNNGHDSSGNDFSTPTDDNYGGEGDNYDGNNNNSGSAGGTSENSDGCVGCNTPWGGR